MKWLLPLLVVPLWIAGCSNQEKLADFYGSGCRVSCDWCVNLKSICIEDSRLQGAFVDEDVELNIDVDANPSKRMKQILGDTE